MTKIAKIDKPEAGRYKNKKKIYFVRNLYLPENATDKYKGFFNQYWKEVEEHLTKIEAAGKVSKIFCESIYMSGEDSMKVLHAMNIHLEQIVKKKIDAGAEFIPLESKELFEEFVDWNNCISAVRTLEVKEKILAFLEETVKARFEFSRAVLRENIADADAALLIMIDQDRQRLDLPDDIEFFLISPPAYDDLIQFIRDSHNNKEFWRT